MESWEYPVDFMILQPRSKECSYSIISGRLATALAVIDCRSRQMKIFNGIHQGWKAPLVFVRDQNPEYVHVSAALFSSEG
jgi:hypothetical protein